MAGCCLQTRTQRVGNGEGDQEVGHSGKEAGLLGGAPALLIQRAALRTVAVVATMVGVVLGVAVLALVEVSAEGGACGTAARPAPPGSGR